MLVARGGFDPPHTGPKPGVLPLDDRAKMPFRQTPKIEIDRKAIKMKLLFLALNILNTSLAYNIPLIDGLIQAFFGKRKEKYLTE